MENNNNSSIDPDSVFLNPEYLEKIRLQEQMQEHGDELPEDVKKYVEDLLDNPLNKVNSKMFQKIRYWIEHPEESRFYLNNITFHNPVNHFVLDEQDPHAWNIEIPLFKWSF